MLDQSALQAEVYLAVLAEEGSFSKAAKRLSTAQSFVTKIIGEVERDMLKVKIFERSTRRVELTEVGRVIVPEIQLALRQAEMAWDLAGYYSRLMNGPIRVGYSPYTHDAMLRILYQLDIAEFEAQRVMSAGSPEPRLVLFKPRDARVVDGPGAAGKTSRLAWHSSDSWQAALGRAARQGIILRLSAKGPYFGPAINRRGAGLARLASVFHSERPASRVL